MKTIEVIKEALNIKDPNEATNVDTRKAGAERPPIFIEAERMFEKMAEVTKETGAKAFEFFRERGGELGKEIDDWFNAEKELFRPVPVEVRDFEGCLIVTAAVPGFTRDEIEVSVKDNILMLSGAKEIANDEKGNVLLREWASDRFFRQVMLPNLVLADKVEAHLKDGMLKLTLPKMAEHEAVKIAVASA